MPTLLRILGQPCRLPKRQRLVDEACTRERSRTLANVSLSGLDLSGLDLVRARIRGVDFRGSLCHGVAFPPLADCILDGLDASHSSFSRIEGCTFRRALLSSCCFAAHIVECDFSEACMAYGRIGRNLSRPDGVLCRSTFAGAEMSRFDAIGGPLRGACFAGARLAGARLSRADLRQCDFSGANLGDTTLVGADTAGARFDGATLSRCVISAEQAGALRKAAVLPARGVRVAELATSSTCSALEALAQSAREWQLDWWLYHPGTLCIEHFFVVAGAKQLRAMVFRANDESPLRLYSTAGTTVAAVVRDIACDSAGFELLDRAIKVQGGSAVARRGLRAALPGALKEMLATQGGSAARRRPVPRS